MEVVRKSKGGRSSAPSGTLSARLAHGRDSSQSRTLSRLSTLDEFELLEYEWPDLPPLSQMQSAIARRTVSRGISYILPVDRGKSSIENVYRTNLRAMFQKPYRDSEGSDFFNEEQVRPCSKNQQMPGSSASTARSRNTLKCDAMQLHVNQESEKVRMQYTTSAPANGLLGRDSLNNPEKLRPRSTLHLPLKAKLPPEALKIKQEAERIIESVQEEDAMDRDNGSDEDKTRRITVTFKDSPLSRRNTKLMGKRIRRRNTETFTNLDEFRKAKLDTNTGFPLDSESSYITPEKNRQVWEWLNDGKKMTEVDLLLHMCS